MKSPRTRWASGVALSVLLLAALLLLLLPDGARKHAPAGPRPPPTGAPAAPPPPLADESVEQAPASEPSEEEAPDEGQPTETVRIRACDLADGSAVPDLLLGVAGSEERLRTGAAGEIEVPVSMGKKVRPVGEGWRALRELTTSGDREAVLWVFRELNLTGLVTGKSGVKELDPARVELILVGVGEKGTVASGRPELTKRWFARHHLGWRRNLAEVQADGTFSARVPRLPGLAVVAQASGWETVRALIDWRSDPSFLRLELTKPSLHIRGRLVEEDGSPLAKRRVRAYVTLRMTAEEYYRFRPETRGHGYGSRVHREKNYAIVTFEMMSWTGMDGSFSIESKVRGGELLLVSAPVGDQDLVLRRLGMLTDDMTDVELIVRPCKRPPVRITERGVPQKSRKLSILVLGMDEQPGFGVQLDDQGFMSGAYLLEGLEHVIRDPAIFMSSWYFTWHGGTTLELTRLSKSRYPKSR